MLPASMLVYPSRVPCPLCQTYLGTDLPCGRRLAADPEDRRDQLRCCIQRLADRIQAGEEDHAALIARVVFRIAKSLRPFE